MLGDVSGKYESGNKGFDAIANNSQDPGGASYGKWQLAARTGTLNNFLKSSGYVAQFNNLTPGSQAFNNKWIELCKTQAFCDAQYNFIKDTHFEPVHRYWCNMVQLSDNGAIDEVLWSIAVQHSYKGCCKIMDNAEVNIPNKYTDLDCIEQLYNARIDYVKGLKLSSNILNSLLNRYKNECNDVKKLIKD